MSSKAMIETSRSFDGAQKALSYKWDDGVLTMELSVTVEVAMGGAQVRWDDRCRAQADAYSQIVKALREEIGDADGE